MFRNLTMFRFPVEAAIAFEHLHAKLGRNLLQQCGPMQMRTRGWVSPYGQTDDALVLAQGDFRLITLGGWDKSIPPSAVEAELAERVKAMDAGRAEVGMKPLGKGEQRRVRQAIIAEMVPRAIPKPMRMHGMIDLRNGWIVVDTASGKAAEDFISQLRLALGKLPAFYVEPETNPSDVLTRWLQDGGSEGLATWIVGDECELRDSLADSIIRFAGADLDDEEVIAHVSHGMRCTKLRVHYSDRCSMVISSDMRISKFQLSGIALKDLHRGENESPRDIVESAAALLFGELSKVIAALDHCFVIPRPTLEPEPGAE